MEKSTFLVLVRSSAIGAKAPLAWQSDLVTGVREHDATLADLWERMYKSQRDVAAYCAARLEGR